MFNEDVIIEYIDRILVPYKQQKGYNKLYLVFDSARCHLTEKVKNHLENESIEAIYVPPRLTNILQPVDLTWFSIIKKEFHNYWSK